MSSTNVVKPMLALIVVRKVFHKFSNCPKQKSWLLESAIDYAVPITRTLLAKPFSVVNESCVIKSNYYNQVDSIEHHLKDAIELSPEIESSTRYGRHISTSLTIIDIALSHNLGVVSKESLHPMKKEV
jgi:hypothetical protein